MSVAACAAVGRLPDDEWTAHGLTEAAAAQPWDRMRTDAKTERKRRTRAPRGSSDGLEYEVLFSFAKRADYNLVGLDHRVCRGPPGILYVNLQTISLIKLVN